MTTILAQPKSERLRTHVRREILDGRLTPGSLLPTQRELGRRHGVAEATAAVALSRLVQEGLVIRKRGKGTFVTARQAVSDRQIDFIRVSEDPGQARTTSTLRMIEWADHAAREKGDRCQWRHIPYPRFDDPPALAAQFADASAVVGMLVPSAFLRALFERRVPVASIFPRHDNNGPGPERFLQFDFDRRRTVEIAVNQLLTQGYRRIAYIGRGQVTLRAAGFIQAVRQHQLDLPLSWVIEATDYFLTDVVDRIRELLRGKDRPDALVAMTDHEAAVVESLILQMGLRVPEDVALIAGDVGPNAESAAVPITTVGVDLREALRRTVEAALALEPGFDPADVPLRDPVLLPLYVTARQSTGAANPAPPTGYGKEVRMR